MLTPLERLPGLRTESQCACSRGRLGPPTAFGPSEPRPRSSSCPRREAPHGSASLEPMLLSLRAQGSRRQASLSASSFRSPGEDGHVTDDPVVAPDEHDGAPRSEAVEPRGSSLRRHAHRTRLYAYAGAL